MLQDQERNEGGNAKKLLKNRYAICCMLYAMLNAVGVCYQVKRNRAYVMLCYSMLRYAAKISSRNRYVVSYVLRYVVLCFAVPGTNLHTHEHL
jgi:hypothetical protein